MGTGIVELFLVDVLQYAGVAAGAELRGEEQQARCSTTAHISSNTVETMMVQIYPTYTSLCAMPIRRGNQSECDEEEV